MTGDRLAAAFESQARSCADLGSPFMARLCTLLARRPLPDGPVAERLAHWEGDVSSAGQSVPLRLAGALHGLRRADHAGLAAVYPPREADDDALWSAVAGAIASEPEDILATLDSAPQTNEVRRSAALIPGALVVAAETGLPLELLELGASAGLNLRFDRYALAGPGWRRGPDAADLTLAPDWQGPPPPEARLEVVERAGVDLRPLDPARDADRLLRYIWPDQPERLALTEAALAAAARDPGAIAAADAGDWLAARLDGDAPGRCRLVFHTVAWQYFPPATQARAREAIEAAGARATEAAPLAWLSLEADEAGEARPGAALTLRLWPGGREIALGRADFHGRWVRWDGPAVPPGAAIG